MASEGHGTAESEQVARTNAGEKILPGGSGGCGEKEQTGEGKESADGGVPPRGRSVCGTNDWNRGEKWDEDDDETCDEGGFGGGGASEACGLKLITSSQKETDDDTGQEGCTGDVTELAMVDDGQSDESKGHAEEIEQQGGSILDGVLDEDEGRAPDGHDCQQQDVGESGGTEAMGQLFSIPEVWVSVLIRVFLLRNR